MASELRAAGGVIKHGGGWGAGLAGQLAWAVLRRHGSQRRGAGDVDVRNGDGSVIASHRMGLGTVVLISEWARTQLLSGRLIDMSFIQIYNIELSISLK